MDNTNIASLLTNLLCLLPFCLGVLGMIAVGALLLWVIRRQRQPQSAEAWAVEENALQSEVASLVTALRPWQQDALADLRTFRKLRWSSFGRNFRIRGLVAASRSDRERTWAAFALRGRRLYRGPLPFHGLAFVRTTAQTLEFHAQPTGEVAIQVDDRPLGSIQPDGTLLDAGGQPVGHRPTGLDKDQPTSPVTLHGRVVARLGNPFYGGTFRFLRKILLPPAVEITAPDTTPDERDWLLALALWNVLYVAAVQVETAGV